MTFADIYTRISQSMPAWTSLDNADLRQRLVPRYGGHLVPPALTGHAPSPWELYSLPSDWQFPLRATADLCNIHLSQWLDSF